MGGLVDRAYLVTARRHYGLGVVLIPAGSCADQGHEMPESVRNFTTYQQTLWETVFQGLTNKAVDSACCISYLRSAGFVELSQLIQKCLAVKRLVCSIRILGI